MVYTCINELVMHAFIVKIGWDGGRGGQSEWVDVGRRGKRDTRP